MADVLTYRNGDPIALGAGSNAASLPMVTVYENTFDPARQGLANGDTVSEFIAIPAGSMILGAMVEVIDGEASVTLDVGDSTDPNGYIAGQSLATEGRFAGDGAYLDGGGTMPTPQFYDTETWLALTIGGADLTTARFRVAVVVANMG